MLEHMVRLFLFLPSLKLGLEDRQFRGILRQPLVITSITRERISTPYRNPLRGTGAKGPVELLLEGASPIF